LLGRQQFKGYNHFVNRNRWKKIKKKKEIRVFSEEHFGRISDEWDNKNPKSSLIKYHENLG
jgi:hypothetical protein